MKHLKTVFAVLLAIFCGSCSSETTYYYVVSSGCKSQGLVQFFTPTMAVSSPNNALDHYVTDVYFFQNGATLLIEAAFTVHTDPSCTGLPITVTIMRGDSAPGSIGSGGSVYATQTGVNAVMLSATAVVD